MNAGGLLSLLFETGETDEDGVAARVRGDRRPACRRSGSARDEEGVPPHRVADRIVEERLAAARAREER